MSNPFCYNESCRLHAYKVGNKTHEMAIEDNGKRRVLNRHVYANANKEAGHAIFLCSICHDAVRLVMYGTKQ